MDPSVVREAYTPAHLGPVLESPDAREGERKDVTVLFADVAGSLAMSTALDPEDLHAVMNGVFAIANDAVHAEGGVINQYRGDCFMALFGAPRALPDNAARACRAALEIRTRSERYAESVRARFGQPLVLRLGLNTGTVWVGSIGTHLREDYTAEGETVGVAARLEELASPGQILVAEETRRRCAPLFEWAELGERELKGLERPVRVFELLHAGPHSGRLEVERERGMTAFTGRDRELDKLSRVASPRPGIQCAEVVGEAGIGKSRLALEHARALPAGTAVLELRSREASSSRAWWSWLELLRRWPAGITLPPGRDTLLRLLEGQLEGDAPPGDIGAELRAVVEGLLGTGPVVLVVDDAHWLDPSSERVLRDLANDPPEGELVLLATLRSGHERSWGPTAPRRIELGPLEDWGARALAQRILDGLEDAPELVELCLLRGGGNPLFLEEVARALHDGPELLRRAARLEIELRRERERVPDTLQNVVAARIDALPPATKRALEAACVLGQSFDAELLGGIEPAGERQLPALLERGLLRSSAADEYDFCHGVVCDVAYAQLLRRRRRELHEQAAEALVARGLADTADGAARIGAHFEQAAVDHAAAPYLVRAGRLYARLDAPAEAAVHLQRGLDLLRGAAERDPTEETEVALVLAACLNVLDRSTEASATLQSIDPRRMESVDRGRLAKTYIQTGWVRFSGHNDLAGGRELIERGLAIAEECGDRRSITLGSSYLARILILDGEVAQGIRVTRRTVELAAEHDDVPAQILGLYNHAHVLCDAGQLAPARQAAMRACELASARGEPLLKGLADVALGKVHLFEGDAHAAFEALERGGKEGERVGQVGVVYQATLFRGYVHVLCGEPKLALEAFEALSRFDVQWPTTFLHRARGQIEVGNYHDGERLARQCLELQPPRMTHARANAVLGLAIGLNGDSRDGEDELLIADAISLCDRLGLRPHQAEAHEFLARLLREQGAHDRARYYAERARAGYEECGMRLHAELACHAADA
jgi:class 3 adenylate cyclase/tetratricopeptide (TPR) repeat protein